MLITEGLIDSDPISDGAIDDKKKVLKNAIKVHATALAPPVFINISTSKPKPKPTPNKSDLFIFLGSDKIIIGYTKGNKLWDKFI